MHLALAAAPVHDADLLRLEQRERIVRLGRREIGAARIGEGLGALGPVSEGLFVWTIGLAVIIGFTVWLTSRSA